MGRMSELHIETCESVEQLINDRLNMKSCEATYELATDVVNLVCEKLYLRNLEEGEV